MNPKPEYQPQTAEATLHLIANGTEPWLALGQFLDDWRRTELADRRGLAIEPPAILSGSNGQWAALLAASVEWLCAQDGLPVPFWTSRPEHRLSEPWFLYPGPRLRAWQLIDTPVVFKIRNIFGGDRILERV